MLVVVVAIFRGSYAEYLVEFRLIRIPQDHLGFQGEIWGWSCHGSIWQQEPPQIPPRNPEWPCGAHLRKIPTENSA